MLEDKYFDVSELEPEQGVFRLTGSEHHHLARVSRVKVDEPVRLLDGRGGLYEARVEHITGHETVLKIVSYEKKSGPPSIDLALALCKAPRLDIAIEKCSELGLRGFIPFVSERSVWRGGEGESERKRDRMKRKIRAACKQSGQPHFPTVSKILEFESVLYILRSYSMVFIADIDGKDPSEKLGLAAGGTVLGIVGPEGGLSSGERGSIIANGAEAVSLGASRLRSETAAICLLYRLLAERGAISA